MKTKFIQKVICKWIVLKFNIPCENISLPYFSSEMDVVSVGKNGYLTEYEVKITRSDFLADLKKRKWKWFELKVDYRIPNYFFYVCPSGLISEKELKWFQGLIYVDESGNIEIVKKAKLIHKYKHDILNIVSKFCTMMTERKYLGCCRLTYKNNIIKERNAQRKASNI